MSEEDSVLLAQYGITTESITIYVYKQHRYSDAKDAIKYARLENERNNVVEQE